MDEAGRKRILSSMKRAEPWVETYQKWLQGELATLRADYEKGNPPWLYLSQAAWCWHFGASHTFRLDHPDWRDKNRLKWNLYTSFGDFKVRVFHLALQWGDGQAPADRFHTAFLDQCVEKGIDPGATGGCIGGGSTVLTHEVHYAGGHFAPAACDLACRIHVFDAPIEAALGDMRKAHLID